MATKLELEAHNKELIAQVEKLQEELVRGGIVKLEENNARFSKGDNIYSVKINQNGNVVVQCPDGYIHVSPISSNTFALFQTDKAMY